MRLPADVCPQKVFAPQPRRPCGLRGFCIRGVQDRGGSERASRATGLSDRPGGLRERAGLPGGLAGYRRVELEFSVRFLRLMVAMRIEIAGAVALGFARMGATRAIGREAR